VVLPLVLGSEAGWPAWAWCAIAAGLALAVLFARVERKTPDPLLNLEVLRAPGLGLGLAALSCTQIAYGGMLFTFTLYLRAGLDDSALRAGLVYLPMAVTFGLAGLCWRRLPARFHRALPIAGTSLSALGYLALTVHGDLWTWGAQAVIGTGLGLAVSPLLTLSLRHVPPALAADASGLLTTAVQLAQLTGVAALGAVFLAGTRGRASAHASAQRALASAHAMTSVSWWMAALSAVGVLAAIALARMSRSPD
jgi:Major Facilitator Superfamily